MCIKLYVTLRCPGNRTTTCDVMEGGHHGVIPCDVRNKYARGNFTAREELMQCRYEWNKATVVEVQFSLRRCDFHQHLHAAMCNSIVYAREIRPDAFTRRFGIRRPEERAAVEKILWDSHEAVSDASEKVSSKGYTMQWADNSARPWSRSTRLSLVNEVENYHREISDFLNRTAKKVRQ